MVTETTTSVVPTRRGTSALRWGALVMMAVALGAVARAPALPRGVGRMFPRLPGPPPDFPTALFLLGVGSVTWYVAVFAFPVLLIGARRVGTHRASWQRIAVLSAASAALLFAIAMVGEYLIIYQGAPSSPSLLAYVPVALRQDLLPFIALVGIVVAIEARRRSGEEVLERERLRAVIAEQRLVALTTQLQPHFLFNTLQSISTLLHRDPNAADEMLTKLSDLLRELLRHRDRALVSLDEELRFATLFLEIAQVRFADRLAFDLDVDADTRGALVPLFILQPLVENALSHGIGRRAAGGRIRIAARRVDDHLQLRVEDDGAGLAMNGAPTGMGVRNTRERLAAAFGDSQSFELLNRDGGGTVAHVTLPFQPVE